MPPLVSVVVPLYNKEKFLIRTLTSIASQSFDGFEAIIVDDGSTDGSADLAARFPDRRFRLVRQANAGPGTARNHGVAEATGSLIALLDADDEWLPGYLAAAVSALTAPGSQAATYTSGYYACPGDISSEPLWRKRQLTSGVHRVRPDTPPPLFSYMAAFMSSSSTVVRTDVIRKWGGFYEHRCLFGEDQHLWFKVLLNETVHFDLEPRVRYHNDASGLSRNVTGARPVEPYLLHPEDLEAVCPAELQPLFRRVLTCRAFKTACMLGFWGKWQEARQLRDRFRTPGDRELPFYWRSLASASPAGAIVSDVWRTALRVKSR